MSDQDDINEALSSSQVFTMVHGILKVVTSLSSLNILFDLVLLKFFLSNLGFFYLILGVFEVIATSLSKCWVVSTVDQSSIVVIIYLSSDGRSFKANSAYINYLNTFSGSRFVTNGLRNALIQRENLGINQMSQKHLSQQQVRVQQDLKLSVLQCRQQRTFCHLDNLLLNIHKPSQDQYITNGGN